MSKSSNLYAEKIFAEHPLALWALDDNVNFVSLLNSNDKVMSGWNKSSNLSVLATTQQPPYIKNTTVIPVVVADDQESFIRSSNPIPFELLNQQKNTFNISTYFKGDIDAKVTIGYLIDGELQQEEEFDYVAQTLEGWAFLSKTFEIPEEGDIVPQIKIKQDIDSPQNFYFNLFSLGQWSEPFVSLSSGNILEELSSYENINIDGDVFAVPAQAYGLTEKAGYYLASENTLYAYNGGFPMVYGAQDVTKIEENEGLPSLIIPGFGFLNDSGKYYDLTAEMWLRINVISNETKRIFGPINSDDGLYINGEFLVIKVGENYASYFVSEWGRPMLIHFRVSKSIASLLVDGEQVASVDINTENIQMPKPFSDDGKGQDWLGLYSHDNINLFEVDCLAIYGYQIPEVVAKRRFVYGQGVESPELSSASLISSSAFIDYRVAGYSNSFVYPDMTRWTQGIADNLAIDAGTMRSPEYALPTAFFNNPTMTYDEWLRLSFDEEATHKSLSFEESNSPAGRGGYLYFENLNVISSKVAGVYGVFRNEANSTQPKTLFKILNKINGAYLVARLVSGQITYVLSDNNGPDISISGGVSLSENELFVAGINIRALSRVFGGRMSKFFGSSKNLEVYLAGDRDGGNSTFYGEIHRFAFMTERSSNKIASYYSPDSTHLTVKGTPAEFFLGFIASYTLRPAKYLDKFELDISTDSYWQDYLPLSRIDGSVINANGEYEKRLSYVQFNTNVPILKDIQDNVFDLSNSQVRMYITFQYLSAGPNRDHRLFAFTQELNKDKVIIPSGNWVQTRYEIIDDTIVYLPKNVDYNKIAIVFHVDIRAKSSLRERLSIKTIQLASQALSEVEPKKIITKFGDPIYPYVLRGVYPDYISENPVSIYKGSTPYMYLTNTSGIRLVGTLQDTQARGIRYVLNQQASNLYRIGASQLLIRYYEDTFPTTPKKILSYRGYIIQSGRRQERIISIYVVSANETNTRGRVFALDEKTGLVDFTVYFYLNGALVKDLFISPRSWNMVGLQFRVALDINSAIGYVDITGPILVQGISNYRLSSSEDAQSSLLRSWSQVTTMFDKTDNSLTTWRDLYPAPPAPAITTWQNVLYIPTTVSFTVDAATPFRIYTGTNKIIVGDSNKLRFNGYAYRAYQDVVWQSAIFDAV